MTNEDLDRIEKYCKEATDGIHVHPEERRLLVEFQDGAPFNILGINSNDECIFWKQVDAEFHFNARTDLPALVAEVRMLRKATGIMFCALERACIASCGCMTKTPDPEFHAESCDYKVYRAAIDQAMKEQP